VPVTGVWDYATHDALRAFVKQGRATNEIGEWGRDPGKVATNARMMLTPSAESEFQRVRSLLSLLGLPSDTLGNYRQYQRTEMASMLTAWDSINDTIRTTEHRPRVAVPQPPANGIKTEGVAQRAGIGLIAVGGAVFFTILALVLSRRRA